LKKSTFDFSSGTRKIFCPKKGNFFDYFLWLEHFLSALFTKVKYTVLNQCKKTDFYTPLSLFEEKNFHPLKKRPQTGAGKNLNNLKICLLSHFSHVF
jgi:hypothetical protein